MGKVVGLGSGGAGTDGRRSDGGQDRSGLGNTSCPGCLAQTICWLVLFVVACARSFS